MPSRESARVTKSARDQIKVQFPGDQYGRITTRLPRYTDVGIATFGETYDSATPQQCETVCNSWTGDCISAQTVYMTGPQGTVMRPTDRFSGEGGFVDDLGNFFVRAGNTHSPRCHENNLQTSSMTSSADAKR